ncbi:MAG: putative toxin-antitoxin system toxin component, PIN family [Chloroflexota bacterium]|nr:putative toxin-antitoxin system toxin component, PIN family [Chloroflexota bacterium]
MTTLTRRCAQFVPSILSVLSVVFDTVIFVRSLINRSGLWGRLVFTHGEQYRLVISEPITVEILEVLHRPELTRKYRGAANANLQTILDILANAEIVIVDEIPSVSRDPKDDKFLATAAQAGADYLVSEDQDLLVLRQYEGVRIVDAATFLDLLDA